MTDKKFDYGMIGLGTMGRNLLLNMSDHGFAVAGFDRDLSKVEALENEGSEREIFGARTLAEFVASLEKPRVIMMLVPAGPIVDAVADEIKPLLSEGDLLVDCGNSHFTDTNVRVERLKKEGIHFVGIGVSGGESGARFGPSIMPGGDKEAYKRLAPMLEAVSAKVNGEPCVAWLGNGSAGHYVKMVHNGIEYALMQLISETYHLLKEGAQLSNDELHQVFHTWNQGPLQSFLIEITADVFAQKDDLTNNYLVDMILDAARQKGTGAWTSNDALEQQVPIPAIDTSVMMRYMSGLKAERTLAATRLKGPAASAHLDKQALIDLMEKAFHFAMITTYAQGLALLKKASETYHFDLQLHQVASIWRGGCIIRAALLEDIRAAFAKDAQLPNLLLDESLAKIVDELQPSMRSAMQTAIGLGIPFAAYSASLVYFDAYRHERLPANLIQAQRDYFGAHTYERIDQPGTFHTHWNQ
jgi:6-phosphogluconate dehydrogenase